MRAKWLWFAGALILIVTGDLITKQMVVDALKYRDGFSVIDGFFSIVHARNRGAAFGMFNNANSTWVLPFFIAIGIAALGFLVSLLRRVPDNRIVLPIIFGSIAGGAIGNMIDRARYGYVVDFLDVYIGPHHWPAFNLADAGISSGVTFLILMSLLKKDDQLFSGDQ